MELFDVRLLFSGELWIAGGMTAWLCALAFAGYQDAAGHRVNFLLCAVLALWPNIALLFAGVVGGVEFMVACGALGLLVILLLIRLVGLADVMVLPGVVQLLGLLGLVAIALGMFVALMHTMMSREEDESVGNSRMPMVAYVSLPACLVGAVALVSVGLKWP